MQRAYDRPERKTHARIHCDDVLVKVSYGVFSIFVFYEGKNYIVYIETSRGEYIDPPAGVTKREPVLHGLKILRQAMVLEDLADV